MIAERTALFRFLESLIGIVALTEFWNRYPEQVPSIVIRNRFLYFFIIIIVDMRNQIFGLVRTRSFKIMSKKRFIVNHYGLRNKYCTTARSGEFSKSTDMQYVLKPKLSFRMQEKDTSEVLGLTPIRRTSFHILKYLPPFIVMVKIL